ncbi:MAG TPA: hypothetical protein VHO70_06045 [Chitinispirillaceae bacterium]|nr:hypothetical protein [Chitinispirillaceae bacterium]
MYKLPLLLLITVSIVYGSNLANPAVSVPVSRITIGASYLASGYTITNLEIPSLFNRIHARVEYSLLSNVSIGVDIGVTQIDVDKYAIGEDSFPVFHGKFGFSGGAHLKVSTPFILKNTLALTCIGNATTYSSKNTDGAMYGGFDGAGAIGLQLHIKRFGYISAGPMMYLIKGNNESYDGIKGKYSNINNLRGWLAIDFFPDLKEMSSNKPFITLEITASPEADYSKRIPLQEFSVSLCIGSVSKRLRGIENGVEWKP